METDWFIALTAGNHGAPGHKVSPEDELRALFEAQRHVQELSRRIAGHTTSPVQAVLLAHLAEDAHRTAVHTQLLAARATQRTLAHELPAETFTRITAIHDNPAPYLAGTVELPKDPTTVPHGRLVFKDTSSMLAGVLHISFFGARDRLNCTERLLPGTDASGATIPPKFPLLAKHLADGAADPGQLRAAAKRLEDLAPHINQRPDSAQLAEDLEAQVAASVKDEDSRTTSKLFTGIETTLTQGIARVPEEILRARLGLHYRGMVGGLEEYLLRLRPEEAEALKSLCASADNPRTKAGDRNALLAQAVGNVIIKSNEDAFSDSTTRNTTNTGADHAPADAADFDEEQVHAPLTTVDAMEEVPERSGCSDPTRAQAPNLSFPSFLVDPASGKPLTDPQQISDLSLDSDSNGFETNGSGNNGSGTNGSTRSTGNGVALSGQGQGRSSNGQVFYDPGSRISTGIGADGLTPPQRHLQALMNLVKAAGRPTPTKKTAGMPAPKLFVIATLAELRELAVTHGITGHGKSFTNAAELRKALCLSGAIPITLNGDSQVLDLGHEQRYFPDYMREAILAIYGGCLVPGCTVPPEHCEIDHADEWAEGGATRIQDGRPFCSAHHHDRHTGLISVEQDSDGLYSVRLPAFLDPRQALRRNNYWRNWARPAAAAAPANGTVTSPADPPAGSPSDPPALF